MPLLKNLRRTAWTSATAMVVARVGLSVPASADEVGILALDEVSGVTESRTFLRYDSPGTPLLGHFFYRYLNEDNHLKTMTALPSLVSEGWLTDSCKGQCTRPIARPPGDVVFVITGFHFSYTNDDHHMDAIGIIENNGQLTHWFNDQNDDDEYDVEIRYVWVPRSRFSSVTSVSGMVHDAGSVTRSVAAGEKVIRGFHVNNVNSGGSGDNHIKRFGFLANSNSVDVFYGDKDPADSADWTYQLNYAILR